MALQYHLQSSENLNGSSGDLHAQSLWTVKYSKEDLLDYISRSGSTVTKADAIAVFEDTIQFICNKVEEGAIVETPLATFRPRVDGNFKNYEEYYNRNRHKIELQTIPDKRVQKAAERVRPKKVSPPDRRAKPRKYYDLEADSRNNLITPGGVAKVTGSTLKIKKEDEEQGIYFVNTNTGEAVEVEKSKIMRNKPSELIFTVPDLPLGSYRLKITNTPHRVKIPRTGRLSAELTVPEDGE